MNIWQTRDNSIAYLREKHPSKLVVIDRTFELIDAVVDSFEKSPSWDVYSRVCGLSLLKAKNLAVGCYGLVLDGLAQESGALLRPLIEYSELLTYFRLDPARATEEMWTQLPKAGERAKAIGGIFQGLRSHLNEHAAHSSFSSASISHLFDLDTSRFKKTQHMVPQVLDINLRDLLVQFLILLYEAILALKRSDPTHGAELGSRYDALKRRMFYVFDIDGA